MRIARRTFLNLAIGTAAAPSIIRASRADTPPITLKLHHAFSAVSSIHDKFLAPWARKVEAESGGRLRIDIFPSMQLGGAPAALFDQARDGTADIVWAAPSLTPGRFPRIETFELPFLASRRALVSSRALADLAAANLQDEFRDFYTICFSCSDRAVIHASGPVRTIEDIRNLKMHVQTRFAAEAMRVLGAQPIVMPSAQLPAGIAARVVEACLDPWHLVPPLRLNDLLRYHTEFSDVSPSTRTYVLAMNKPTYDRLPRDLKPVLDNNSGQVAAAMAGAMWDIQAAAVANMAVERGDSIVTLLPEAVARWRKAAEPVADAWRKEIKEQKLDGGKLIAAARTVLAKYATEPEPRTAQGPPPAQQQTAQPPQSTQPPQPAVSAAPPKTAPRPAAPSVASGASQPMPQRAAPSAAPSVVPSPPGVPTAPTVTAAPAKPMVKPTGTPGLTPSGVPMTAPGAAAPASTAITPPAPAPPAHPPNVAAAPAAPPPLPKPVPKTLDIPL
jgi:TRAP-type C4-dicarboxylate transport system substrate-binding protein